MAKKTEQKNRKVRALAALATHYQVELTETNQEIYLKLLEPYSAESVERACFQHLRESQWMPKASEIIQHIEGSPEDKSLRAWLDVLLMLYRHGTYQSITFRDPATRFAIQNMGGWASFGRWLEEERPFREKEFRELYCAYRGEPVPLYLPGLHEMNNTTMGFYDAIDAPIGMEPMLISPARPKIEPTETEER